MPLSPLASTYDQFILDLDGSVWIGDEPTPRAVEAVEALRDAGKQVAFATNDPRSGTEDYVARLWKIGIREPYDPKCGPCLRRECKKAEHRLIRRGNLLVLGAAEQADAVGQFVDGFRKNPVIFRHIGRRR